MSVRDNLAFASLGLGACLPSAYLSSPLVGPYAGGGGFPADLSAAFVGLRELPALLGIIVVARRRGWTVGERAATRRALLLVALPYGVASYLTLAVTPLIFPERVPYAIVGTSLLELTTAMIGVV